MNKVTGLRKQFGDLQVLADLSITFPDHQITVVVGPSGCGKTTLLRILAGLLPADQGRVALDSEVSYVFQEPRLLPWLTVRENIALVIRDKMPMTAIRKRVDRVLQSTGIEAYADYCPLQLSGGLKQRVALARAFAYPAPLLLMDEPFKSLDLKIRMQLIADFVRLWREQPQTVIFVTHDVWEATQLGDRILLLSEKPAGIAREFTIAIPQEKRLLHPDIAAAEQELIQGLLA